MLRHVSTSNRFRADESLSERAYQSIRDKILRGQYDRLAQGAQFLKQSVQAADPAAGAQAFGALTEGRGMLTATMAGLK